MNDFRVPLDTKGLSALASEHLESEPYWSPEDYGDILEHQLRSPIATCIPVSQKRQFSVAHNMNSAVQGIKTLGELLFSANPPIDLLGAVKAYAKERYHEEPPSIPRQISQTIYHSTIILARIHHAQNFSSLQDGKLLASMEWLSSQDWMHSDLIRLFNDGIEILRSLKGGSDER